MDRYEASACWTRNGREPSSRLLQRGTSLVPQIGFTSASRQSARAFIEDQLGLHALCPQQSRRDAYSSRVRWTLESRTFNKAVRARKSSWRLCIGSLTRKQPLKPAKRPRSHPRERVGRSSANWHSNVSRGNVKQYRKGAFFSF